MGFTKTVRLSTSMLIGFGAILALLVIMGGVSVTVERMIDSRLDRYNVLSSIAGASASFEEKMLRTRLNVKDFIIRGTEEEADEVRHFGAQAKEVATTLLKDDIGDQHEQTVESLAAQADVYLQVFNQVTDIQAQRNQVVFSTLNKAGPELRKKLTEIMRSAYEDGDPAAAYFAGLAQEHLMLGRLYVQRFLIQNDEESVERALSEFSIMQEGIQDLLKELQNPSRRALASAFLELSPQYTAGFERVVELITNRNDLIKNKLDKIGPQIVAELNTLGETISNQVDTVKGELTVANSVAFWVNIIAPITGIAVGLIVAIALARSLAGPIQAMTSTMKSLADKEVTVDVPAMDYRNEIGEMAKAVQVFKENIIRAEELAEEQKVEQEQREMRAKQIQGLTQDFDKSVAEVLATVSSASNKLKSTADSMSSVARETTEQATAVAAASEEAAVSVQTVSSSADELSNSIGEISQQVANARNLTDEAQREAKSTGLVIEKLSQVTDGIGDVVSLITDIAEQTNLLALNATIEAARAGDAGKGFAVVANEVKSLANQTGKATEQIARQIQEVQSETKRAVSAISTISSVIENVNVSASSVAAAVEQQAAATEEIARSVEQVASGTDEVNQNISGVSQSAGTAGTAASDVLSAAGDLSQQSDDLKKMVEEFLTGVRAA